MACALTVDRYEASAVNFSDKGTIIIMHICIKITHGIIQLRFPIFYRNSPLSVHRHVIQFFPPEKCLFYETRR